MKNKVIVILILVTIFGVCFLNPTSNIVAHADASSKLSDSVKESLDEIDLSEIENIYNDINSKASNIFDGKSLKEIISAIISGDYTFTNQNFLDLIFPIFVQDVLDFVPLLCVIVAIVILCSFISQLRSNLGSKSVYDIVHFACYGVIVLLIAGCVFNIVKITNSTLNSIKSQMEVIFPVLLTLITAIGGTVSVSVYQPAVILLTSGIMKIFDSIIFPLFILSFVFIVVQNISKDIKLNNFTNFFNSLFKWIIGVVFTIFFAFLSIQGISANTYDSISIKTAKYTIKSYVPFLGNYISDGMDLILSSSVLIKNGVGVTGLIILVISILSPLIKLIVLIFGLKLVSSILEPVADSRITSFLQNVGKTLSMLVACILGISFMYFLTIGIMMCTCNLVV